MTGTTASLLAFAALLVTGVAIDLAGRLGRGPATAAEALGAAMRTTPGRLAVLATWAWIGVHFLAR